MNNKQLMRVRDDRMILGVAGGLADYLNIDPVLVRLVFVVLAFGSFGQAALVYLILAILMPEAQGTGRANHFDEEEIIIKEV